MLQNLIVGSIVLIAAVWVLKNAYSKIKTTDGRNPTCGCGCSDCGQSKTEQSDCDRSTASLRPK